MVRHARWKSALSIGVAAGALFALPAAAQTAVQAQQPVNSSSETTTPPETQPQAVDESGTGDIVVTARRREESLLRVPIAVTAFSGEALERSGAIDVTDLADVTPNVTFENSRGTNSTLTAFIRGVGQQDPVPGFEAGVGVYLDDVYLNRPQAAVLDIYDVQRIEILRGPQGTLYGRNTIGGALKYVTRELPDHPELTLRGSYGSYNQADGVITASAPIGDMFRIGGAVARLSRGGFGRDLYNGLENYNKDVWAYRGTVEFRSPDHRLFVRLTGDYTHDFSNPRNGHRLVPGLFSGAPVLSDVFDTQAGLTRPHQNVQAGGGSMTVSADITNHLTLRSISAYREDRSYTPIDFDALPSADVDVPAVYRNNQTSQEFQLLVHGPRLNGVFGFYYLNARASTAFDVILANTGALLGLPGLNAYTAGDVRTDTSSFYGDLTFNFTRQISLSLGGRYTWDQRDSTILKQTKIGGLSPQFGGTAIPIATATDFRGRANYRRFTPRASLSFQATPDHLFYISYSEGFKGGGFDPRGSATSAPISNPAAGRTYQDIYDYLSFDPESVQSYEIGWKASLFDRRLTFALDAFHSRYRDVQIPGSQGLDTNGDGINDTFIGITTNAARAHMNGVEFEGNAVLARNFAGAGSNVTLAGTLGYIDAKYERFIGPTGADVANVRVFQNTPRWTTSGTLGANLPIGPGSLNASTTVSYRSLSHQFETASPFLDQPGYTLWDANLTYSFGPQQRYSIGVHARNLTDVRYKTSGYQYINVNIAGQPILTPAGGYSSTLGLEGIATAFYGNPRQVFGTFAARF